ncbi:MAG: 3-hydroxyacyl-CoA dehydrogenase, partial [Rhodospirillales bacterium]|nr:3-hydroxyacyl-CoA dehydrogenase [Rhodospirillales bacterium]
RAAVVGAGTMGGGIAMSFANAGIPVTLIEVSAEALRRGLDTIGANYRRSSRFTPQDVEQRLALISGATALEAAAEADVVVEAVFEEMDLKKRVFASLDKIAKPDAILATNTSYLDINEIARTTARPDSVLGTHFFSPANVMRLLEIVRGEKTSHETLATAIQLGKRLGKVPVVVGVCHGFVGNRMLGKRSIQAERLLLEGALPQDVDSVVTEFGFPMGPFAMGDLAGLDVGMRIRRQLGTRAEIADTLCEMGRYGQKTGAGFYRYEKGSRAPLADPEVEKIILDASSRLGVARRPIGREEILERMLYPMINEGARILEEGIASRPGDIDVIWIYGYGWPSWRGGPMWYAEHVGRHRVAERLEHYARLTGDASLRPAAWLTR